MAWFSDWISGIIFICGFTILTVLAVGLLLRRQKARTLGKSLMILLVTSIFSCIIGILISKVLIQVTQASVIAPRVQNALDKMCSESKYIATEGEFYLDSGFHWRSSNNSAECVDYQEGWVCTCSPK